MKMGSFKLREKREERKKKREEPLLCHGLPVLFVIFATDSKILN